MRKVGLGEVRFGQVKNVRFGVMRNVGLGLLG